MESFEALLEGSAQAHGHLCPGQVVGVRMAMEGCRLIGLDNPRRLPQIKKLLVYVELDRCAADAIGFVTGARLGRRSLKFVDHGVMAATFVNLESGRAWRLLSTEESRDLAGAYAPDIEEPRQRQIEAYKRMPLSVLLSAREVEVAVPACDMPGPTRFKAVCGQCGQVVRDKREVMKNGRILCRACAYGAYYRVIEKQEKQHVPEN